MIKRKTPLVFLVVMIVSLVMAIATPGKFWGTVFIFNAVVGGVYLCGLMIRVVIQDTARKNRAEVEQSKTDVTHER